MIDESALRRWYVQEVLPLEGALMRYIRRNWRNEADVADLRQDIYARVLVSAREGLPVHARAFVFAVARNHLINCAKRAQVVSIRHVADMESLNLMDVLTPDRHFTAKNDLLALQQALNNLPPRCREIVILRKVEDLNTREVAERLSLKVDTVEKQLAHGMRALTDFLQGGSGKIVRTASKKQSKTERGV